MATMVLALGAEFVDPIEKLRSFFLVSKTAERTLPSNTVDALHHLFSSIEATVLNSIQCQSAEEFAKKREKALPRYAKLMHAISLIAETETDEEDFSLIACDALNQFRDDLASMGIADLGSNAAEQADFCIFTMKRIVRAIPKLNRTSLPNDKIKQDRDLWIRFIGLMLLAQFHLDCLRFALRRRYEVPPPVITSVLDGMSTCAYAYATVREALVLRDVPEFPLDSVSPWDEEDQALLDDSEHTGTPIT